jgi:hypothetical protein
VPDARDAVIVADGSGREPGREVFSGMRVTFPQWSPTDGKLSVWFTFTPSYRCSVSWLLERQSAVRDAWGLRPGDPAAVFDPQTGAVTWLAINAHEKAQVGHYYLLRRDYTRARQWYGEAEREWPAGELGREDLSAAREMALFQYYCLTKLGQPGEARARLEAFRHAYGPELPAQLMPFSATQETRSGGEVPPLFQDLLRDLYAAEVFLSLDAAVDGREFFRTALAAADTDAARLGSAVVMSQLLLLEKKEREYAALVTDTILPLLLKAWPSAAGPRPDGLDFRTFLLWDLLPLYAPEFLARLPERQLREATPRWQALRTGAGDDETRLLIDLFLEAAQRRLGREAERLEVVGRIAGNPARAKLLPAGGVPELLRQVRTLHALLW